MTEKRILALLAMLLGLVGGLLILLDVLDFARSPNLDAVRIAYVLVALFIGVAILLGSLLIYRGRYSPSGILNIVLGVVALVLPQTNHTGGILAIVSGIIGLVAGEMGR
ncbi:MAG TPA: hypothetical protein VJP06_01720 [Thermoplasmata archaeon]|nr:hypothetical protein [Thermoplasmata archaeon]